MRTRAHITAAIPPWARAEWPEPAWTADRIASLPYPLSGSVTAQWRVACHDLAHTPAGTGAGSKIIRRFDAAIREHGVEDPDGTPHQYARRMISAATAAFGMGSGYRWASDHDIPGQTVDAMQMRATDPSYWRRRYRRETTRKIESAYMHLAPTAVRWCSQSAVSRAIAAERRTAAWAADIEIAAANDDGGEITVPMSELIDPAARAKKQYAELLARSAGAAKRAERAGLTPRLITITVPPEMHPTTSKGGPRAKNPDYDGTTPAEAHRWIAQRWRTFTRWAKKKKIKTEWVRGVQPHRDGTPHWHVALWAEDGEFANVERYLRRRYLARERDGAARYKHGIDIVKVEGGTGGAAAYISRVVAYISRNVEGSKDADEARRATAWAAVWGIRRYQTSHDRVTVYRMLRRRDVAVCGDEAEAAQVAARAGDYAEFMDKAEAAGLRPAYVEQTNKYGEDVARCIGIRDSAGVVYVPTRAWVQRPKKDAVIPKNQVRPDSDRAAGSGAGETAIISTITPHTGPPALAAAADGGGGGCRERSRGGAAAAIEFVVY